MSESENNECELIFTSNCNKWSTNNDVDRSENSITYAYHVYHAYYAYPFFMKTFFWELDLKFYMVDHMTDYMTDYMADL